MTRTLANLLALALALVISLWVAAGSDARDAAPSAAGQTVVTGADGRAVPVRSYQRIVSLTVLTDPILLELVEPERLIAVSAWSQGPDAYRLGQRPRLRGAEEVEAILALKPDLVVLSGRGVDAAVARLRAAGIAVFDVGDLVGWSHCLMTIQILGTLVDASPRAERLRTRQETRLAAVTARIREPRPTAIWVAPIGDRLYGGTRGSSYHDLLESAGCRDRAAERFQGWPEYSAEDLLALDADLIVTTDAEALRRRPGMATVRSRIIALPPIADDPGLGLVEAVELLRAALDGLGR